MQRSVKALLIFLALGLAFPADAQFIGVSGGSGGGSGVPSIAGTTNQINQSGSPGATTLSLSSTIVVPGTLTVPSGGLILNGSGSGSSTLNAPATGGGTAILPAGSGTLVYSGSLASYLPLAGGTMTGTITGSDGGTWGSSGFSTGAITATTSFTATGLVTNADLAHSTISGIALGNNLGTLTFGTHLVSGGSSYNGSTGVTITSDATNANTASTIVARDGSGNFTAGAITASLTGHASLDLPLTGGTLTGELVTVASATGTSGFNLPPGTAPTSPANGDMWTTSAGLFARINGATIAYGAGASSANPSATIGLSAVNGSASTFMTSDSAPPLSQAIVPTWTGVHTFAPTASATPTAESWAAQSVLTGTSNTNGANWTFKGSQSTGTGTGGSFIFQTAQAGGSSGSSQNALASVFQIDQYGDVTITGQHFSALPFKIFYAGGAEYQFSVNGTTQMGMAPGNLYFPVGTTIGIGSSSSVNGSDTILTRRAAASWNLGNADAASPVAQTLSVQSVVAGTSNTAGTNWTFAASASTGSGLGGAEIFQTSLKTAASTTQNSQQEVMRLDGNQHVSFSNSGAPTVSSCGTSPSIDAHASDTSGTVTVGTVAAASCTITFKIAYATWNHCSVTSQGIVTSLAYSYTTSAITVTGTSLVGDALDYRCDGQ